MNENDKMKMIDLLETQRMERKISQDSQIEPETLELISKHVITFWASSSAISDILDLNAVISNNINNDAI